MTIKLAPPHTKQLILAAMLALAALPGCKNKDADKKADAQTDAETTLTPEQKEAEYLKLIIVDQLKDSEEIQALRAEIEAGNDDAKEKLALLYLAAPASRADKKEAQKLLKSVKKFKDPDAAYQRGLSIYASPVSHYSEKTREAGINALKVAAKLGHPKALQMTLDDPEMKLHSANATQLLDEYFTAKTEHKRTPELIYDWAKHIEGGKGTEERVSAMIQEAANNGHVQAKTDLAIATMEREDISDADWRKAVDTLRNAATMRNEDACFAMIRLLTKFKNEPKEFNFDQQFYLNTLVQQSMKSADQLIYEYAELTNGNAEACTILQGNLGAGPEAHAAYLTCLSQLIDKNLTRDTCDTILRDIPWQPMSENRALEATEMSKAGMMIRSCYGKVLLMGDDYPSADGAAGTSTAVVLADFYLGNSLFQLSADPSKRMSFLVYGANEGDWQAQWILSGMYAAEGDMSNPERACYWADKAYHSEFCHEICKENADAHRENHKIPVIEACSTCEEARVFYRACSHKNKKTQEN